VVRVFLRALLRCVVMLAILSVCIPAVGPEPVSAKKKSTDFAIPAPYYFQGNSGYNSATNCGMAVVAAALAYSQVAYPSVADVRYTVGHNGPTNIGEWAWLLDVYGAKYENIWSQEEINASLKAGKVIVVAVWMGSLSAAWDYEQAWSPNWGQAGRYNSYIAGHSLLIVGMADDGASYLVHDPYFFPGRPADYYDDGTPKGAYRKYNAAELWWTIATYANGRGLAVEPPPPPPTPPPAKRISAKQITQFLGPSGGKPTTRDQGPELVEPPRVRVTPHTPIYQPPLEADEAWYAAAQRPRPRDGAMPAPRPVPLDKVRDAASLAEWQVRQDVVQTTVVATALSRNSPESSPCIAPRPRSPGCN